MNDGYKKIVSAALSAGVSKLIVVIAPLISTPLLLAYLGSEKYGLWMVMVSITTMLSISDLGIANGVTNKLVEANEDSREAKLLVGSAYLVLFLVSVFIIITLIGIWVALPFIWPEGNDYGIMMIAVFLPFALNIPAGFIQRILYIDKKSVVANCLPIASSFLSIIAAYLMVRLNMNEDLVLFVFSSCSTLVFVLATLYFFARIKPDWLPDLISYNASSIKNTIKSGRAYLLLSSLVLLANQCDYLIVSSAIGLDDVAIYSIANRVVGIATAAVGMLGIALWPIYSDALRRGDFRWVSESIIRLNVFMTLAYFILGLLLVYGYNKVTQIWLGASYPVSSLVLIGLVGTSYAISIASPYFMVLNSRSKISPQILLYIIFSIISIPLKFYFANRYGVLGVSTISFIVWAFIAVPWVITLAHIELRNASDEVKVIS
jgi:O-antigen/teichoic acid export membrane protein